VESFLFAPGNGSVSGNIKANSQRAARPELMTSRLKHFRRSGYPAWLRVEKSMTEIDVGLVENVSTASSVPPQEEITLDDRAESSFRKTRRLSPRSLRSDSSRETLAPLSPIRARLPSERLGASATRSDILSGKILSSREYRFL